MTRANTGNREKRKWLLLSTNFQLTFKHVSKCRSRQDGSLCDLTLLVDGKGVGKETEKIHVHKVILTAASSFLKELYLEGKLQGDVFVVRGKDHHHHHSGITVFL